MSDEPEYLAADAETVLEVYRAECSAGVPEEWAMESAIKTYCKLRAFVGSPIPAEAAPETERLRAALDLMAALARQLADVGRAGLGSEPPKGGGPT